MITRSQRAAAADLARERFAVRRARKPRSFLSVAELDAFTLGGLVDLGLEIKHKSDEFGDALRDRSVALLFQKTSTRTRCSFEAAALEMNAQASYIDWSRSNFVLADLRDEVIVMSRYYDMVVARVDDHRTLQVMAEESEVPIVNGLCDRHHPCQAVSDILTLREYFGSDLRGLRIAFIGDENNVYRSLVQAAALVGARVTVCSPVAYRLGEALEPFAAECVMRADDPFDAVAAADVVYTDTWVSMGQEREMAERLNAFEGLCVDERLMAATPADTLFMHCLPAHPGQEVSAGVLRSPRSIVFEQAENRKHAQKALMLWLLQSGVARAWFAR